MGAEKAKSGVGGGDAGGAGVAGGVAQPLKILKNLAHKKTALVGGVFVEGFREN